MGYRGKLVVAAVLSCNAAIVLGIVVGTFALVLVRDRWHLGCELSSDGGSTGWVCPDGIGYALGGLVAVAALAGLGFMVSVVIMVRRWLQRGAGTDLTRAVARDLGWVGATPLVLQTPLTVLSWMSANVSVRALMYGLLLGAAGLLPFVMVRAQGWRYAVACLIAAVMALLTVELAALVAPFLLGFAALLGCAAAVSLLGEHWRPKTPDGRRTA